MHSGRCAPCICGRFDPADGMVRLTLSGGFERVLNVNLINDGNIEDPKGTKATEEEWGKVICIAISRKNLVGFGLQFDPLGCARNFADNTTRGRSGSNEPAHSERATMCN